MDFSAFSPHLLRFAIEHELQNTNDAKMASIIALKRLKQDPDYYSQFGFIENMTKARVTKFVRKWRGKDGKWEYEYAEEKKGWLSRFTSFFKMSDEKQAEKKIKEDYKTNAVDEKFGISLKSWTDHVAEYFNNKDKWQAFFGKKKEEREKKEAEKKAKKEKKEGEKKKPAIVKLSVMKFINDLYGSPPVQAPAETIDKKQIEKDIKGITSGSGETSQSRAKAGGEIGPNGEWYKGGAFIATTEMPKKIKQKIIKAGEKKVEIEPFKYEISKPGQMSILDKIISTGSIIDIKTGELNYQAIEYYKLSPEYVKTIQELYQKYKSGERWVSVVEYPELGNIRELSQMLISGMAIPGVLLDRVYSSYPELKGYIEKWSKPAPAPARTDETPDWVTEGVESPSPDNFETMPEGVPSIEDIPEDLFAQDETYNYYNVNGRVYKYRKEDIVEGVTGISFGDQIPVPLGEFLKNNFGTMPDPEMSVIDSVKKKVMARSKRGQNLQESTGKIIQNVMDYLDRGVFTPEEFLSDWDFTQHTDLDLGKYVKNPIVWNAVVSAVRAKYFPTEKDIDTKIKELEAKKQDRGVELLEKPDKTGSLPPHLQAIADKQKGFEVTDVTPEGYGPETPEQKKIDKQAEKAIATVTPENRAEKEAEAMFEKKEPWGMTFKQYKKTLFDARDPLIIKRLQGQIDSRAKQLTDEYLKNIRGDKESYIRTMKSNMETFQETLDRYLRGEIDDDLNPKPTWDYLQSQYDSMKDKNSPDAKSLKRKLSIRESKAQKEHERLIKNAIKDGSTIPADVLKEYPELSKDMAKEIKIPDINYKPTTIHREFNLGTSAEPMKLAIQDYSRTKAKDIYLVDENIILDIPRPSYIPELDLATFAGYRGNDQMFDVVRLDANQYVLVDKKYKTDDNARTGRAGGWKNPKYAETETEKEKIEKSKYYLMNAETLAATWDYYQKLHVATELKKHDEKQDLEEKKYYSNKEDYEKRKGPGTWPYAPFKRTGKRIPKTSPDAHSIAYRNAFMVADFFGLKGEDGKGLTGKDIPKSAHESSPAKEFIFKSYRKMLKELNFKIHDMRIQKAYNDESDTYKKGRETAYGDKGLKDNLKSSHGVRVKRQNGTEITDQEITKIGMLLDDAFSVFKNRKSMSGKFGLKISYAGEKRMHASQAVGMFIPSYKTIAISDYSIEGRGFSFAHEFAHFMDAYLGEKDDHFFSSDKDGSISNDIASTFRSKMSFARKGKSEDDYVNRTCECFARAMEQFYAIKKGEQKVLYEERNTDGRYVEHDLFVKEIMPLCEKFITENDQLLKSFLGFAKDSIFKKIKDKTGKTKFIKVQKRLDFV